jgi:hypothetical protein
MAKDSLPSLHSLEKPENLQALLKEDRGDDCLPCKIVGESRLSVFLFFLFFSCLVRPATEM